MRAPHATFTMRGSPSATCRHGLVHGTGSENTGDGLMRTTESGEGTNGQRYFEAATEHGVVRAKKPKNAHRRPGAAAPERT